MRIRSVLALSLCLASSIALAEGAVPADAQPDWIIAAEPFGCGFNANLERTLSDHWTASVGARGQAWSNWSDGDFGGLMSFGSSMLDVGVAPGVSYFVAGRAPEGLWVGPRIEFGYQRTQWSGSDGAAGPSFNTMGVQASVLAGYTMIWRPGMVLQLGAGVTGRTAFGSMTLNTTSQNIGVGVSGRGLVAVGYAF